MRATLYKGLIKAAGFPAASLGALGGLLGLIGGAGAAEDNRLLGGVLGGSLGSLGGYLGGKALEGLGDKVMTTAAGKRDLNNAIAKELSSMFQADRQALLATLLANKQLN